MNPKETIACIDLGGTRSKLGLFVDDQLVAFDIHPSFQEKSTSENLKIVQSHLLTLCQKHQILPGSIRAIGLAFPGLVDRDESEVISSSGKYEDAPDFDFKRWARRTFDASIVIDNDSRLACLGEKHHGSGKRFSNMVMVTLGTGIGTGVVIDGNLIVGKHYQAGCLGGHFPVMVNGRKCHCGNRGCVEAEASLAALEVYARALKDYNDSLLIGKPHFDFKHLFQAYRQGDPIAKQTAHYCMDLWATALVAYIHAYDPEAVIIGGGVMQSQDIILPYLRSKTRSLAWTPLHEVQILPASLNDQAGLFGAYEMCKGENRKIT